MEAGAPRNGGRADGEFRADSQAAARIAAIGDRADRPSSPSGWRMPSRWPMCKVAQSHMKEALKQLTLGGRRPGGRAAAAGAVCRAGRVSGAAEAAGPRVSGRPRHAATAAARQAANRGSRSQRQLDQLELSADENRYETQRSAPAPEENAGPARIARDSQSAARPGPPAGRPQRAASRAAVGAAAGRNAAASAKSSSAS